MGNKIGITDKGTLLYAKISPATTYSDFIDITGAPATGAEPNQIEMTVLKSETNQFLPDRLNIPALNFTFNYTEDNYTKALTAVGVEADYLYILQDGSGFKFKAIASVFVTEVARASGVSATFNCTVSSIEWKTKTEMDQLKNVPCA